MLAQRTIKTSVSARGVTLHSGEMSTIKLMPADVDTGIVFCRVDLAGKKVTALNRFVSDVRLSTTLEQDGVRVSTVEHLLSALSALGIDNLIVEIDCDEIPIMDGSAAHFIFLLESAGFQEQSSYKKFFTIKKPVYVEYQDGWAKLLPHFGFKVSVEIDFAHKKIKESGQKLTLDFAKDSYFKEISRARTFGQLADVDYLRSQNLARGASTKNAIALDKEDIVKDQTLRYSNEFVKHKILDVIGDLYLLGGSLVGAYVGYKVGHALNHLLLTKLLQERDSWQLDTFESDNTPIRFYSHDWQKNFV